MMAAAMEPIFSEKSGWQRIYIDLPGMGKTKGEDWITGTDDMLQIMLEFIDSVIPNQSFLVAGESYGGYLARGIALHKRERVDGMALICPMIVAEHSGRDLPAPTVIMRDEAILATLTPDEREEFTSMAVVQDSYNWQRFRDEILTGVQLSDVAFLEKLKRKYGFSFDVDQPQDPFSKPVLFFMGRQDSATGYRDAWRILENYPRATFAVLDRAGHNTHIEQKHLFDSLVHEWIDRVEEHAEQNMIRT